MTKPVKRSASRVAHRLPKRRKSSNGRAIHKNRDIDWEEQKQLPERFREDPGVWPVLSILAERSAFGGGKEYLLEWEPHPATGEVFDPTWEAESNVGDGLISAWKTESYRRATPRRHSSYSGSGGRKGSASEGVNGVDTWNSVVTRRKARRLFPESPTDNDEEINRSGQRRRRSSLTRDSAHALLSSPAVLFEISETQEPAEAQAIVIDLPPPPSDRTQYETLASSQINGHSQRSPPVFDHTSIVHPSQRWSGSRQQPSLSQTPPSALFTAHNNLVEALRQRPTPISDSSSSPTKEASLSPFRFSRRRVRKVVDSPQSNEGFLSPIQPSLLPQKHASFSEISRNPSLPAQNSAVSHSLSETPLPSAQRNIETASSFLTSPPELESIPYNQETFVGTSPWAFNSQQPLPLDARRHIGLAGETSNSLRVFSSQRRKAVTRKEFQRPPTFPSSYYQLTTKQGPKMATPPAEQPNVPPFASSVPDSQSTRTTSDYRSGEPVLFDPLNEVNNINNSNQDPPVLSQAKLERENDHPSLDASVVKDFAETNGSLNNPEPDDQRNSIPLASSGLASPQDAFLDSQIASLPIHQSIEEEISSSLEDHDSLDSKASSSQQSLENERIVPRMDGMIMPTLPILGPAEYVIPMSAEGKVQSTYMDTLKAKKKSILKFINRRDTGGSAQNSNGKVQERNEMIELIQRLHDTTTHLDLGLPGFSTQYSIRSEEHAAYANYAGSKFAFLGHLVDVLRRVDCPLVIMAQSGTVQDLLEDYLAMKRVIVRRHDRLPEMSPPDPRKIVPGFQIDLVSTTSFDTIQLRQRPNLVIAFDSSFDAQDPRVKRIRSLGAMSPDLVPVVHLLVPNSSEHVDRCLPKSMPSPIRLKLLIRATYQARMNIGGEPTYIPDSSDTPEGRPMDLSDLQRAVRKSLDRKLVMMASIVARGAISQNFAAHWNFGTMQELQLDEMDEPMVKPSQATTTVGTPKDFLTSSRSPVSRAVTPSGRKRFLEPEMSTEINSKRQRLTPVPDVVRVTATGRTVSTQPEDLPNKINALLTELAEEKRAREHAEQALNEAEKRADEWRQSHADLQRRYEKRMKKTHDLAKINKKQQTAQENAKARQDKTVADNLALKAQGNQLKSELASARNDLKAAGGEKEVLEQVREEGRALASRNAQLEKAAENMRKDFEFTRTQYQTASNKAAEFASQVSELESQVGGLQKQAGEEKRRLKELNYQESTKKHLSKVAEMEMSMRSRDILLKKLEEENRLLKKNRGVQTRGSSVQPGSPGQRSRQASPAYLAVPSGSRTSVLRHER